MSSASSTCRQTPVDAIVYTENVEGGEAYCARQEGRCERREAVYKEECFQRGHLQQAVEELVVGPHYELTALDDLARVKRADTQYGERAGRPAGQECTLDEHTAQMRVRLEEISREGHGDPARVYAEP